MGKNLIVGNLIVGTHDYELFNGFKKTAASILDRSVNRVGVDIQLDSDENWADLAEELDEIAVNLANAALLATAFATDARTVGKALAGVSLMEEIDDGTPDWLAELMVEAQKSSGDEALHSKDITPEVRGDTP